MAAEVTPEHLISAHGMDPAVVQVSQPLRRGGAKRHATLWLEMKHAADHAQRRVGHEHTWNNDSGATR